MTDPQGSLTADVAAAIERGDTIEAIKLLREGTGIGLTEAKDTVEKLQRISARLPGATTRPDSPPSSVAEALQRGDRTEAIRLLRSETGLDRKDSTETVDAWIAGSPALTTIEPRRVGQSKIGWIVPLLLAGVALNWLLRSHAS